MITKIPLADHADFAIIAAVGLVIESDPNPLELYIAQNKLPRVSDRGEFIEFRADRAQSVRVTLSDADEHQRLFRELFGNDE